VEFSNFSTHSISLATLKTILSAQNTQLRKGDILFIRMGVIPEWDSFSDEQKRAYAELETPQHAGVEASLELLEWLWDEGVSAVAGDAISWEVSFCFLLLCFGFEGVFREWDGEITLTEVIQTGIPNAWGDLLS
jgi:hypothetical protein